MKKLFCLAMIAVMVAIMLGADNGFFYTSQVMHFSSPFTVFLIYHKQSLIDDNKPGINNHAPEVAASLSRLYIRLQELGIGEEAVAKEVDDLCRTLSL
jgi:hypothetical protein